MCSVACCRASSMIGAMLIFFVGRPLLYWGNLSVYMMSYVLVRGQPSYELQPAWFLLFFSLSWSLGMWITDFLAKYIDVRTRIFLGIVLYNFCFFGSVLADQVSWVQYLVSFAVCSGFGIGLFEIAVLKHYVVSWSFNHSGLMTSIYLSSGAGGAAILNMFMTWWVNPYNWDPDVETHGIKLFSQDEILNNITKMFYIIGGTSIALQILGFCLLREPQDKVEDDFSIFEMDHPTYGTTQREIPRHEQSIMDTINTPDLLTPTVPIERSPTSPDDHKHSLLKLMRSRHFLGLWFLYFCAAHSKVIVNIYYKIYGEVWIRNDFFLTDIGSVMPLMAMFSTMIWGIVTDAIGVKSSMKLMFSILTVTSFGMYLMAGVSEWGYFAMTAIGLTISNSVFFFFIIATGKFFGQEHLSRNVAVVSIAPFLTYLMTSIVLEFSLVKLGWIFLFMWIGGWCVIGLVVSVLIFPKDKKVRG